MSLLQVRDLPDKMYEDLREAARQDNRSVPQQTIAVLREYLYGEGRSAMSGVASPNVRRRKMALQRLLEVSEGENPLSVDSFDPVALIRQGREQERALGAAEAVAANSDTEAGASRQP